MATMVPEKNYVDNGYLLFKTGLEKKLEEQREKFIQIFQDIANANGINFKKNDSAVMNLSNTNHDLWVAAYDQLRFLPEILSLTEEPIIKEYIKKCGIVSPVVDEIVIRGDMPNDDKWLSDIHQDFTYFQGSMNCIAIWIPFQEITNDIGPLNIISSSHKNGVLEQEKNSIDDSKFSAVPMKIGDALIFSQFLIHRSGKNRSDKIRFSLQIRINDLNEKEWAQRKFFFPKRQFVQPPEVNFPTKFPY